MKAYRNKDKINQEWQDFLDKTNGSLRISWHCLERVAERFPEMLELTQNEFLALVRAGKPVYTYYMPADQRKGIILRNGKVGFAVSFDTGKIMTTFPYKQGRTRQISLNPKGGPKKKRSAYHRPSAKKHAQKEIQQEL